MESFFSTIRFFFGCGTILVLSLIVLAHLPKSPLRSALVQICGWATAAICGAWVLSPVDPMPEILLGPLGLFDDIVAAVVGFMSARAAWRAGNERHTTPDDEGRKAA
jgi:uncharacterized membrane protein YkvA (DUF1232 family)